jgi:acetylornithine deacetylase/succinyl-diaminopimelate desuccinylase-like protein
MRDNIETEFPTGVINWTNEEGARFPMLMVSSGVWAGEVPPERAHDLQGVGGGTANQESELERIGYLGKIDASHKVMPIGAHLELHIEQEPVLEGSKKKIGAVHGVQAYKWYMVIVKGRECHTGTTEFANRSDAMRTAAELIVHSHTVTGPSNWMFSLNRNSNSHTRINE